MVGEKKRKLNMKNLWKIFPLHHKSIRLEEIPKILDDMVILRKGTLAAEIKLHRNRIDPQREVLLKIANEFV